MGDVGADADTSVVIDSGDAASDVVTDGPADTALNADVAVPISGTLTGLVTGSVILTTNAGNTLTLTAGGDPDAGESFTIPVLPGSYVISTFMQPAANELCTVLGGSGMTSAPPAQLTVTCDAVASLAAGAFHTCALLVHGGVDCWGDNTVGELGDGTYRSGSGFRRAPPRRRR